MAFGIWYILSFYVIILLIFIFCYTRILMAIRRQAGVMTAHAAAAEPSTDQTRSCRPGVSVLEATRDRCGAVMVMVLVLLKWSWLHRCSFISPSLNGSRYLYCMF